MAVRVRETAPPPKRPRGQRLLLVAAVVVVVAALVAAGFYFGTRSGDAGEPDGADPSPSATAQAPMPTGDATAALGSSTRKVAGFAARGFPQTETGAVEAAMAWKDALTKLTSYPDEASLEATADAAPTTSPEETRQFLAQGRETSGLAADGSYPDLGDGERYYDDCLPAYGAYRVTESAAAAVTVEIWVPCVYGPGSPDSIDRLQIRWSQSSYDMAWQNGDWRVSNGYGTDAEEVPRPGNIDRVDTTYRERAELLGNGWTLFQGSSQAWPSDLLGSEPRSAS